MLLSGIDMFGLTSIQSIQQPILVDQTIFINQAQTMNRTIPGNQCEIIVITPKRARVSTLNFINSFVSFAGRFLEVFLS